MNSDLVAVTVGEIRDWFETLACARLDLKHHNPNTQLFTVAAAQRGIEQVLRQLEKYLNPENDHGKVEECEAEPAVISFDVGNGRG